MGRKEKVTRVIDGDTFEMERRKKPVKLANTDTPEKGQLDSAKAMEALCKMTESEEVRIETVGRDKCGRAIARVYIGRKSINKKLEGKPEKLIVNRDK